MNYLTQTIEVNTTVPAMFNFRSELLSMFVEYLDASPNTVATYKKALRQFFAYLNFNNIKRPSRVDILSYRDGLVADGYKATTIQNYVTAVKIFFNWTALNGYYPNIAQHIKGAKLSRDHKKDYLTSSQVKEVLEKIDTSTEAGLRDYAILVLMLTGGLRTIEVIRANIGDMRTLADNTVLYVQGKGKTEKTDYVKISPKVEQAIRAYLKARGSVGENEPLFTSTSNNSSGNRLSTRSISGIVKTSLVEAGFNSSRLTAHSLRHTAVTLSLLAGKDITEVQQFARHANIATTMIYNHALDKAQNSCSEAITNSIF